MRISRFSTNVQDTFFILRFKSTPNWLLLVLLAYGAGADYIRAQESEVDREFLFAQQLYDDSLYVLAAEQFKLFASAHPSNAKADDALFYCGDAYFGAKKYDQAFQAYKQLEINYPQSPRLPEGRLRLAQSQAEQGNFAAAAELFRRVAVFHPEDEWAPKSLLEAGRAFVMAGQQKKALAVYFRLLHEYDDSVEQFEAHLQIVEIYLSLGRYEEAIKQTDGIFRAYGTGLNDPRVYALRARVFERLGQAEEANAIYTHLISEFPGSREAQRAYFYLGTLFQQKGEYEHALTCFEKVTDDFHEIELLSKACLHKGDIYFELKQYEQALANYRRVSPQVIDLRIEADLKRAKAHVFSGDDQLAVAVLKQLIANPSAVRNKDKVARFVEQAYVELAQAFVNLGSYNDALDAIEQFLDRYPGSKKCASLHYKKAEIIEKHIGDFTRALRAYDFLIETFPYSTEVDEAQLALGRCYENLGQYQQALIEYEKYLHRFPAGDHFEWVKRRESTIKETCNLRGENPLMPVSHLFTKLNNGSSDVNWHYELGKVYYEIKEFHNAIQQFKELLRSQHDGIRNAEIYYYLGDSYYKLSQKNKIVNQHDAISAYLDSATISLNYLINAPTNSKWMEAAARILTEIRIDSLRLRTNRISVLNVIYRDWENSFPESKFVDLISITLANALMAPTSEADTASIKQALGHYQRILLRIPESAYYEEALYKEAIALDSLGADSLAKEKLGHFLAAFPRSHFTPEALLRLAQLESQDENFEAAIKYLQTIQNDFYYSPMAARAKIDLAEIYFQMGDYQSALDAYKEGLSVSINEARACEALGNSQEALSKYVSFIRHNPEHPRVTEARLAVARISQKQGNVKFAKEYYESISKHSNSAQDKYLTSVALADLYFEQELFAQAREHYLQAISWADEASAERYPSSQAVRCRYKLKQFAAADADAKVFKNKFEASKNEEGQFLLDKGQAYMDDKNFELAEKVFKKLKSDFKHMEVGAHGEFGLGAVYLITNHTDNALKILTNLPSKYPDSEVTPLTYFNLGDFYYKSQQVANAIEAFKQTLAHPKANQYHAKALRYLIKCYNDAKLWDQAIAYTRQYLDRYPYAEDSFGKAIDIAKNLMHLKEYRRAIERFNLLKLNADAETEAEIQFYIGQCYKEMGDFERATSEFLKVKYLTKPTKLPWHVTALFEAGNCLIRQGEIAPAQKILKRIIDEDGAEGNFGRFARQKLEELETGRLSFGKKEPH